MSKWELILILKFFNNMEIFNTKIPITKISYKQLQQL